MQLTNLQGRKPLFSHTLMAAALLLIFGPARGQEAPAVATQADEIRRDLAIPNSRIALGIGLLSGESRRSGQYSGRNDDGGYALVDLDLIRRDDLSGTWLKLRGRNLGLDSRELRFEQERQGDWSYFFEAGQLPRHEPLIVRTGLAGIGSGNQTIDSNPANRRDVDLKLKHDIYSLGARKFIAGNFDVRVSFKQDDKRGERMYGRGTGGAHEFLTEPLDRTTRQWDVVVGYRTPRLQLSGGYSGSSFDNYLPRIDVAGGSAAFTGVAFNPATGAAPQTRFALPLSNQAHQLFLSGGYNFTDTTRSSFKLSRSLATQDAPLESEPGGARLAGAPASIDGKVVTTLGFADLTLRPSEKLDMTASLRYEDRDDQTPVDQYILTIAPSFGNASGGVSGFRIPRSLKQAKGLVEAGYQLGAGYRLVGAIEHELISRNVPEPYRRIAYREKTDETLARLELKRSLSETLNGSVAYIHSDRRGSDYVADTKANNPVPSTAFPNIFISNQIGALLWTDRSRDKLRLTADWLPSEDWSVQVIADLAEDRYSGRNLGPRDGWASFLSADAAYTISDQWKFSAWVSHERTEARQETRSDPNPANSSANFNPLNGNVYWQANPSNQTTAWGIGLKGKPRARLEVGADLSASTDTARHDMNVLSGNPTDFDALPEVFYRQIFLKLFADVALDRQSGLRVDFIYEHRKTNDWTWQNYVYGPGTAGTSATTTDGTTVRDLGAQNTRFVGVSYHHRWR